MSATAQPLFLGSHAAVDFLNTAFSPNGKHIETIPDGRALLEWMAGAALLEESQAAKLTRRLGAKALDGAAQEARKLREWARPWLERWRAAPDDDYEAEIAALNRLLARTAWHDEVVVTKEGAKLVERVHGNDPDALLGLIASQIAALITKEDASLIRSCAGSGCTLWFLDRTKSRRRLFCSAAACGNRAKVAAFRERQRAS